MRRLGSKVGILVGLVLGLAGIALGAVGLMAMGTTTPKLVVFVCGLLVFVIGASLVTWCVFTLRRTRIRSGA